METTALYVELIIIGLETSLWITSFITYLTNLVFLKNIGILLEKLPASILLLGILYVLGMIFDRIADLTFTNVENKIRTQSGLEAKSSILIWKQTDQESYLKYTRSKVRILRSSSLNIPLFTFSLLLNISKYYTSAINLMLFIIIVGILISYFSFKGYEQTDTSFYNKARILELDIKKHSH